MKTVFLILCATIVPIISIAQSKYDKITFNEGQSIDCYIARVSDNKIYYHTHRKHPIELESCSLDKVADYQFNGDFFYTNKHDVLEHSEIIDLDGISQEAIYRGLKTWIVAHSDEIAIEDNENFIIQSTLKTVGYFKIDAHFLFDVVKAAVNPESEQRQYTLRYTVTVRAKDNRAKIVLNEFVISNNQNEETKTLKNIFEKRHTSNLGKTLSFKELNKLRSFLSDQINDIEFHCTTAAKKESIKSDILDNDEW